MTDVAVQSQCRLTSLKAELGRKSNSLGAFTMEVEMANRGNHSPHYPVVEMVIDAVAVWIRKHRHAADLDELARCSREEVEAKAVDLGMTSSDLRSLAAQGPGAADLLERMLAALNVDRRALGAIDPRVARDLQKSCIACGDKTRCEHEFAAGTAVSNMQEFCPNAATLESLFGARQFALAWPH